MSDRLKNIYAANRRDIYAYLCRLSGDSDLALDLLQESFLNYFEHYRKREMPDDVSSRRILFRIARNLFINHVRSKASKNARLDDQAISAPESAPAADHTLVIQRLIQGLPERERTAIVLRYLESMRLEDIGAVLGLSISAVSRLISRSEKMLEWEARKAGISLDE